MGAGEAGRGETGVLTRHLSLRFTGSGTWDVWVRSDCHHCDGVGFDRVKVLGLSRSKLYQDPSTTCDFVGSSTTASGLEVLKGQCDE